MLIMFRPMVVGAALAVLAFAAAPAFAGSGWQPTGSMTAARSGHSAALLTDGRVLAISGFDGTSDVPVAELYTPTTGSWTVAAPPLMPRQHAAATTLLDGRVLVMGGQTSLGTMTQAELYDPADNSWTATGSMGEPRQRFAAVRLDDGRVLVTGGSNGSATGVTTAELYDPTTGTWSPAADMGVAREHHQATVLPDGRVLVAGGNFDAPAADFTASSEIYDPVADTWTPTAPMLTARSRFGGGLLPDGTVLVAGGVNGVAPFVTAAERFDPVTGEWTPAGSTGLVGTDGVGVVLRDGRFLLTVDHTTGTTPLYDPTAAPEEAWSSTYASANARYQPSITLLEDGRVLLAGGAAPLGDRWRTAELFVPPTERAATGGDFGTVEDGEAREQDVTLANDGGSPLWIDGVAVAGPDAGDFAVVADACTDVTLEPTETCVVRVRFTPSAVGTRHAELTVDDNAETSPAVALTGTVAPPAGPPVEPPADPPLDPPAITPSPIPSGPPAPAPVPTPAASCTRRFVTLAGIAPTSSSGRRLQLTGVAAISLAGRSLRIERNGRVIATTKVASDGRIDATVTASRSDRARRTDRYRLVVPDGARSRALKAQRRVSAERTTRQANGAVVVTGRIRDVRRPVPLTLRSDAVCGPKTRSVVARTDRSGRFRVTLPAPVAGSPAQIHRLWWGTRSVSLPVVVTPPR